ncbi:MAG TPA: lipoate--protein ligase family protein [Geobacteraceae bacterium]|nr:lipoate--protein ligase family protein [Geobacteraceae bacterium]
MIHWRLIDTGPLDGPANMAVDEALLACFNPELSRPVLRLYGWEPPAISLGRFQLAGDVLDLERCAASGIPVVRRVTGGGAIFHAEELTYAIVCAPHQIPPAVSVKDSFRVLTGFLLRFYGKLGLESRYAADCLPAGARLGERTPFCFAGMESCDVLIGGKKIGGNAQRRLKNVIFQHGSIPIVNRAAEGANFLRHPPARIGEVAGALRDFGERRSAGELKRLMAAAFAESFPGVVTPESLTAEEGAAAASRACGAFAGC